MRLSAVTVPTPWMYTGNGRGDNFTVSTGKGALVAAGGTWIRSCIRRASKAIRMKRTVPPNIQRDLLLSRMFTSEITLSRAVPIFVHTGVS